MNNIINEGLAKQAHENRSFRDYVEGSATNEYNAMVAEATQKIEKAKEDKDEETKQKLDYCLARYQTKLANWLNESYKNGAGHVSVMICGAGNYPMRKHEKFLEKERKLHEDYESISDIGEQIRTIVYSSSVIRSGDSDAVEKLKEKLEKALAEHQGYKDYNTKARKEGTPVLMAYVLQNSNGRIKGIRDRLERLEKEKAQEVTEENIGDIKVIDNTELSRIQIIFPGIPDAALRTELKRNGFKWAPSQGAWQNFRNKRNLDKAKELIKAV